MKDYYDIWMLCIAATFGQRGTAMPASRPPVLSDEYSRRPETMAQWAAFVKRLGVSGIDAPDSLVDVVDVISMSLMPPAGAAAAGQPFIDGDALCEGRPLPIL